MSNIKSAGTVNTYSLKAFNILLVEDYEFLQQLITGMLKSFGVGGITVCSSGDEAKGLLQVLSASRSSDTKMVDIVLTDWMMPDGDGEELIRWMRDNKDDKIKFLPVILVSAFTDKDTIVKARDIGANEALVKPVSGEALATRILNVINYPRPYIQSPDYFGPDRRRKEQKFKGDEKRKTKAEEIKVNNEQL
ncbi:MAG: response regulator [Pseudomonadota bacterium]